MNIRNFLEFILSFSFPRTLKLALYFVCLYFEIIAMHISQGHRRWTPQTKRVASCCLFIQGLSASMYTSDCASAAPRMSSLQRGWVDTQCSVGSCAWLCMDQLPGRALAVPEFGIGARRSLPGQEARAPLNFLPDGCAIALTDPRAELLPKCWQNPWLLQ